MLLGYNNKIVDVTESADIPDFSNISKENNAVSYDSVKIEIFDDFNCKKCTEFALNTIPKIKNLEKENSDIEIRLYFVPDINDEIYYKSALSLKCAADQNAFWDMYAKIHKNKNDLNKKSFLQFGKELNLNTDALEECIKEETHKNAVDNDIKLATGKNIKIKPTLIINEYRLLGNQPLENIERIINKVLTEKNTQTIISANPP